MDIEKFIEFNNESNGDKCLDIEERTYRLNYNDVREIIRISPCLWRYLGLHCRRGCGIIEIKAIRIFL